jgi:hypothetical protein
MSRVDHARVNNAHRPPATGTQSRYTLAVLREIRYVRQERKQDRRRWFTDDDWDVYVWNRADGSFSGFQLCYGKTGRQRALTWMHGQPPSHTAVKEDHGVGNHGKEAAMLVADGTLDPAALIQDFMETSAEVDPPVREYIAGRLRVLAEHRERSSGSK